MKIDFAYEVIKGNIENVKKLIDAEVDVNAVDDIFGFTALKIAASRGYTEIVKMLLAAGADVNARNEDGYTALMYAVAIGNIEIVKLLIDAGADVNQLNNVTKRMKAVNWYANMLGLK